MQCVSPVFIARKGSFPCGKCIACRIAKAREWSLRLLAELSYWDKSVFLTLTYSDEYLPSDHSLHKEHLQKFFKRLRFYSDGPLKYYACGEYGDNKANVDYGTGLGRPHYHAIIFGVGADKHSKALVKASWRFCDWSNFAEDKVFGQVTYDSCRYVSDYIFKKYSGELADEVYLSKGCEIPFKIQSQGLGLRYCLDNAEQLKENRFQMFRGQKMSLPRYYLQKLGLSDDVFERVRESLVRAEEKNEKYESYLRKRHIPVADLPDIIENAKKQREMNYNARLNLYKKGEL